MIVAGPKIRSLLGKEGMASFWFPGNDEWRSTGL